MDVTNSIVFDKWYEFSFMYFLLKLCYTHMYMSYFLYVVQLKFLFNTELNLYIW